jgi:hypothetical protein
LEGQDNSLSIPGQSNGGNRRGEAGLITMHASETIINLVADGVAEIPQPWARNDLLWAGRPSDPAARSALRRLMIRKLTIPAAATTTNDVLREAAHRVLRSNSRNTGATTATNTAATAIRPKQMSHLKLPKPRHASPSLNQLSADSRSSNSRH